MLQETLIGYTEAVAVDPAPETAVAVDRGGMPPVIKSPSGTGEWEGGNIPPISGRREVMSVEFPRRGMTFRQYVGLLAYSDTSPLEELAGLARQVRRAVRSVISKAR